MNTRSKIKPLVRVGIRWMISSDMREVLAIEQSSSSMAWNQEEFARVLRQRNCIGMVAEVGDEIAGFMVYELEKTHFNLINFAVRPSYRRRGVGSQMINKLWYKLDKTRKSILVHVRESNLAAQLFFRSEGFDAIKVIRGHFATGDDFESAYVMEYFT